LQTLTGHEWTVSKRHYQKPLSEVGLTNLVNGAPIALLIRRPNVKLGHWVACTKDRIYDPEMPKPLAIERYDRADWRAIRIIYPLSQAKRYPQDHYGRIRRI